MIILWEYAKSQYYPDIVISIFFPVTDKAIISIATGHWGCGSFGGNKQAKALIQLMAAAEARKQLVYHDVESVGVEKSTFLQELETFVKFLVLQRVSVAQLYSVMLQAGHMVLSDIEQNLFNILYQIITS